MRRARGGGVDMIAPMSQNADQGAPLMLSVSGLRGIVGASLTPEVVCRFASAAAWWIAGGSSGGAHVAMPRVVLAGDGRRGGEALRRVMAGALASCGCHVIDLGVATTPTVGVMVKHLRAHGGVQITASHNPAQWNGVKIITPEGAAPDAKSAASIIARFKQGPWEWAGHERVGVIEAFEGAARVHVDRVLASLKKVADVEKIRARRFTVVLDSVNASGALAGRMMLEELGCTLVHLHGSDSGVFPHVPEPTKENLTDLGAEVRRSKAHVGFAQDPDADRLAIIDDAGEYIGEEYTLVLSAAALLGAMPAGQAAKALLAANLSTSRMLDDTAQRFGASVLRTAVGEANVVAAMQQRACVMGGEGNGGVIWPEVTLIRDSLSAMALTLALMTREGTPLSQIVRAMPSYAIEKRKVELRPGLTERALQAARGAVPGARVDDQDGVRLDFPSRSGAGFAWVHVRASNTEPILRLIAEAPTIEESREILDRVGALLGGA